PVILSDIFGDPNVGVFSFANENIAVLPAGVSAKQLANYGEALGTETCAVGIADSRLVGIYVSGNSNSILLPYIATKDEVSKLRSIGTRIAILLEKKTALGNLILCNDYGAIIDPRLKPKTVSAVEKALKVPVKPGTIGGLPQVGSLATASNKGVLCNPIIEESEKSHISEVLRVPVTIGTVNSGIPYPKAGVVVNSKGAVVGSHTLGSELLTLSQAFQTD
ncbi:MAG TPA: translation initiation factor IF-6, partial [Candidatus Bathyarchaeia archaeon]|nr:translation initiation factor IF-6 [Candidatus Bathyarchaeia archaeon]